MLWTATLTTGRSNGEQTSDGRTTRRSALVQRDAAITQCVTTEAIREVRRRAAVSSLDAMQALSATDGDLERAIDHLQTPRPAMRSLRVAGSHLAARLAAALISGGVWFQCEQLGREQWRFSVDPTAYARLLSLHSELDVPVGIADKQDGRQVFCGSPNLR